MLPASMADGTLGLTCQRENSVSLDDLWEIIVNQGQSFFIIYNGQVWTTVGKHSFGVSWHEGQTKMSVMI